MKKNEKAQKRSNIIFDTSVELHRAITMSDCYFGDGLSSLVALYQATGKPIMTQNINYDSTKNYISISCICEYKNAYWAVATKCNALLKIDKDTFYATYIGSFPNEINYCPYLYTSVVESGGKLYFAPRWANEIGVYDVSNDVFEKIPLTKYSQYDWWTQTPNKFIKAVSNEGAVYFIGYYCSSIIKYDSKRHKVTYLDIPCIELEHIYATNACVLDDKIFIPLRGKNAILILNMKDDSINVIFINKTPSGFAGLDGFEDICCDGSNLWLLCHLGRMIVKFDLKSGKTWEIPIVTDDSKDMTQNGIYFGYLYLQKNKIFVFPNRGNCFATIHCETNEVMCYKNKLNLNITDEMKDKVINKIAFISGLQGALFAYNAIDEGFVKFNNQTETFQFIPVRIKYDDIYTKQSIYQLLLTDVDKAYLMKNPILQEYKYCDLPVFLSSITDNKSGHAFIDKEEIIISRTSGQDIHNYVKGLIQS